MNSASAHIAAKSLASRSMLMSIPTIPTHVLAAVAAVTAVIASVGLVMRGSSNALVAGTSVLFCVLRLPATCPFLIGDIEHANLGVGQQSNRRAADFL